MTKRIGILIAVFAVTLLTACSSQIPVHVNLAPIHATLDPNGASKAGAEATQAGSAGK